MDSCIDSCMEHCGYQAMHHPHWMQDPDERSCDSSVDGEDVDDFCMAHSSVCLQQKVEQLQWETQQLADQLHAKQQFDGFHACAATGCRYEEEVSCYNAPKSQLSYQDSECNTNSSPLQALSCQQGEVDNCAEFYLATTGVHSQQFSERPSPDEANGIVQGSDLNMRAAMNRMASPHGLPEPTSMLADFTTDSMQIQPTCTAVGQWLEPPVQAITYHCDHVGSPRKDTSTELQRELTKQLFWCKNGTTTPTIDNHATTWLAPTVCIQPCQPKPPPTDTPPPIAWHQMLPHPPAHLSSGACCTHATAPRPEHWPRAAIS